MAANLQAGRQQREEAINMQSSRSKVVRPREGEDDNHRKEQTVSDANLQSGAQAKQFTRRTFADAIKQNVEDQVMAKKRRMHDTETVIIQKGVKRRSSGEDENVRGQGEQHSHLKYLASGSSTSTCNEAKAIARLLNVNSNLHKLNELRDHTAMN